MPGKHRNSKIANLTVSDTFLTWTQTYWCWICFLQEHKRVKYVFSRGKSFFEFGYAADMVGTHLWHGKAKNRGKKGKKVEEGKSHPSWCHVVILLEINSNPVVLTSIVLLFSVSCSGFGTVVRHRRLTDSATDRQLLTISVSVLHWSSIGPSLTTNKSPSLSNSLSFSLSLAFTLWWVYLSTTLRLFNSLFVLIFAFSNVYCLLCLLSFS